MRPFTALCRFTRRLIRGQSGATTAEYALLAALVALVCTVAVLAIREPASNAFDHSGTTVGTYPDP